MDNKQTKTTLTEQDLEEMLYYLDYEDEEEEEEEEDPVMSYIKSIRKNEKYYRDKYMKLNKERRSHQIKTRIMVVIMIFVIAFMCFVIFAQHMAIVGKPIQFLNINTTEQTSETVSKVEESESTYQLPNLNLNFNDRTILNDDLKLIPSNNVNSLITQFDFTIDNNNLTNNTILCNLDINKI